MGGDDQRSGTDRRRRAQRAGDRERASMRSQSAPRARRVARGAIGAWATLATVGVIALSVQGAQNTTAVDRADVATRHANTAAGAATQARRLSRATLGSLQAEAAGLCAASNNTRAYVDDAHAVLHRILETQGRLAKRTAVQLSRGISRGVRTAGRLTRSVGRQLALAAGHIRYLAPIDCAALTANPLGYRGPAPVPFGSPGVPPG